MSRTIEIEVVFQMRSRETLRGGGVVGMALDEQQARRE